MRSLKVQFYLIHISNMLEVLNSSVNFFIYFAYHQYFRSVVTSCVWFAGAHRGAPATTTTRDGRAGGPPSASRAASHPDVIRLREVHAEVSSSAGNRHRYQQQKQQTQQSSEADTSWRSNSQSVDNANEQTVAMKTSELADATGISK